MIKRAYFIVLIMAIPLHAQTAGVAEVVQLNLNVVWTIIAATLVFFMQAGFAMVEAGLTRAKNAANIIMKNLMDFSVAAAIRPRDPRAGSRGGPDVRRPCDVERN